MKLILALILFAVAPATQPADDAPRVYAWQAAPAGVELPDNIEQAVRIHRRGQSAVAIAERLGYQPGDTIGVIVHADGDQLPDVLSTKERIDAAKQDKLAAFVPLLEWTVDEVTALHDAGYVIEVIAADYEAWLSPWAFGREAKQQRGGNPDTYFGSWRANKDAVQQAMDEDQYLMQYRLQRSLVLPLRAAGIDAPIVNYGMSLRGPEARDLNNWRLPSLTLDGVSNPVLYSSDNGANAIAMLYAGRGAIAWVGLEADAETVRLIRANDAEIILWFNHGSSETKHAEMGEAFR